MLLSLPAAKMMAQIQMAKTEDELLAIGRDIKEKLKLSATSLPPSGDASRPV